MTPQQKQKQISLEELKNLKFAVPKKLLEQLISRGKRDKRHQIGEYILINGKDLIRHILREIDL